LAGFNTDFFDNLAVAYFFEPPIYRVAQKSKPLPNYQKMC